MSQSGDVADTIFDIIQKHPGIHFRGIQEKLGKQIGVLDYHLNKMLAEESIISVRHRGHKLFFEKRWEVRVEELKQLIDNLRKSIPREILLFLAQSQEHEKMSIKEIAYQMQKSPSNFHWHVKRLIEDNVIQAVRYGRLVTLKLNTERSVLNNLGMEIFPNRWERFLDDIEERFGR